MPCSLLVNYKHKIGPRLLPASLSENGWVLTRWPDALDQDHDYFSHNKKGKRKF
ncbi:hypothetical protein SLEP1_g46873 [Rubroshorea leprosula]|uniref:Uncharacterized protein n=1 Tax=Rubroshorea leprosula TaxID=152421 RepID=A0AAV5LPH8_9ROSI|nr:hypothetical protein SLEP1_g46873 [Rubroshorea leprosula]